MSAKLLSNDTINAWRESISLENRPLAVIVGSFAILQPGNLQTLKQAAQKAGSVMVMLEPTKFFNQKNYIKRAEFLSFLKSVTAICDAEKCSNEIEKLKPYIMVDCLKQNEPDSFRSLARKGAVSIIDIPPLSQCFTKDIVEMIQNNKTPVPAPPSADNQDLKKLKSQTALWREQGKKIITVNGCFDILHTGHARMLEEARNKGDELIALVNDDDSVRAYKGEGRPVFPVNFRLQALSALSSISAAYPFSGDNPLYMLDQIRPHIHVKGGTFEEARVRNERELLNKWGGRLEFASLTEGLSTTRLVEPILTPNTTSATNRIM